MKRRKITAMLLSAALGAGMVTGSVSAADSYKAAEKAALEKDLAELGDVYEKSLAELEGETAEKADITLSLSPTGTMLLGMFTSLDFSWLSDVTLSDDVSLSGNQMSQNMQVLVNGEKICTLEYYMDLETMDIYMRIPEISDSYLKMNYIDALQQSEAYYEDETAELTNAFAMLTSYRDMFPDTEIVKTLISRYFELLVDGFEDAAVSEEEITAGGVSQNAQVLSGTMSEAGALETAKAVLQAMQSDEELKGLLETWLAGTEEFTYESFQEELTGLLADLDDDSVEYTDTVLVDSKLWLDENDEVIGREISFVDEEESAVISVKETASGDDYGFRAEFSADGESFLVEGSGTMTDGLLNGSYDVSVAGEKRLTFTLADYDPEAVVNGYLNGTYSVDLAQFGETEEGQEGFFSGMAVNLAFAGDEKNGSMVLDLQYSGEAVAALSIIGAESEFVPYPDEASFETVYDINNEEDMNAYMAEVNPEVFFAALENAGMPADFVENFLSLMYDDGSSYEEYDYEYETEDTAASAVAQ